MMRIRQLSFALAAVAVLGAPTHPLRAQRDRSYDFSVVSQVRIDLRDLGYLPSM